MIVTIIIAVLVGVCGALPIVASRLGDDWRHKGSGICSRDLAFWGGVGVIILTIIQTAKVTWDSGRAERAETENRLLVQRNVELSEDLIRYSGKHDIYPQVWFFRGSGHKIGSEETLASTIPMIVHNPGEYPIYDVDVQIMEVLEKSKWQGNLSSRFRAGAAIATDAAGNVIPPAFVGTNFHFDVLLPERSIQKEIAAPPPEGKSNYVYYVSVSARNGETRYRFHFVKTGDDNGPPRTGPLRFYDFLMAYKILKVEQDSTSDSPVFINKLVEEYHDPKFPVSQEGTIDYGPDLLGFTESSP